MLNKKIRNTALGVLITLFLLWGGLWLYYQIALSLNYFGSAADFDVYLHQGHIAKALQDDMEHYRYIHGTYPKIGEQCQDIISLKSYLVGSTFYDYHRWTLNEIYPERNILLRPQPLWKFSVSVKEDGSAYVIRVEDRNNHLTGIMHIVAHYVVWADFSNKDILSVSWESDLFPKRDSILSGVVFGCDCTGLNYCVGNGSIPQP